jgi:hypothetical protein
VLVIREVNSPMSDKLLADLSYESTKTSGPNFSLKVLETQSHPEIVQILQPKSFPHLALYRYAPGVTICWIVQARTVVGRLCGKLPNRSC